MENLYKMIDELKKENTALYKAVSTYNNKAIQGRIEIEHNRELIERAEAVKEMMKIPIRSECNTAGKYNVPNYALAFSSTRRGG